MNIQSLCLNCFAERRPESPCEQCGWRGKAVPEVDGQLAPGSFLHGRYVVGQPLGRGGFSITYRGWDTRLQRLRAIKEYFPAGVVTREGSQSRISIVSGQGGLYSDGIQKYLAEARVLAHFEGHPCIVFPTDFFEENATAYLVMEYLQGETLRQYVIRHGGRIPYEHAVYFLTPVLRALATVHQAGMLHRDVSPDNVFLTVENETKLLDFGAARQRLAGQSAAMTVIIRDHYAPPEQYSETGKQGNWTDIYAFAATFYYALTGDSPPSALSRLMSDDMLRPSELGATLPPAAETMLLRALAIQPKERPQQIDEVLHALLAPPQPIVARDDRALGQPTPLAPEPTRGAQESTPALDVSPPVEPREEIVRPVETPSHAEDAGEVAGAQPVASILLEAPQQTVTRPGRAGESASGAPSFFRSVLDTALEERWWRWPIFALVAVVVALSTYALLEWRSPSGSELRPPVAAVPASTPPAGVPPLGDSDPTPGVAMGPTAAPEAPAPQDPSPVPTGLAGATGSTSPKTPPAPALGMAVGSTTTSSSAGSVPTTEVEPTPKPASTPPATPLAKPTSPPSTPTADPPTPAPAGPQRGAELAGVYKEGRELVRSKARPDRKRGYELVQYAAEGGYPEAEQLLGSLYVDGIPTLQMPDDEAALKWYRKAAKHGVAQARYDLARRLELGIWEKKVEYVEECAWWVPFCKADLPQAQVRVEVDPEKDLLAYLRSQSPAKRSSGELKEALALYKTLADQGNTEAQERIGYMLVAGNGIEPNRFEAFLWFLKAARKGDASAQYIVGKMYSKGEGIAPNDDAAACWLRKAAAAKVSAARRALVVLGKAKPTGELEPPPTECRFKPFEE